MDNKSQKRDKDDSSGSNKGAKKHRHGNDESSKTGKRREPESSKVPNVRLLYLNTNNMSNFPEWKNDMKHHCYSNYGRYGELIEHGKVPEPTGKALSKTRPEDLDKFQKSLGLNGQQREDIKAMFAKRVIEREIDLSYKLADDKLKVYADLFKSMSRDLQVRVESSEKYKDINTEKDPLKLLKLIEGICVGTAVSGVSAINKLNKRQQYDNMRQQPWESVPLFARRFQDCVDQLKQLNATVDSAGEQTAKFINGLDGRFTDMKRRLLEDASIAGSGGTSTYPESIAEAVRIANEYATKISAPRSGPTVVFNSNAKKRPEKGKKGSGGGGGKSQRLCFVCDKPGHMARECPTKAKLKKPHAKPLDDEEDDGVINFALAPVGSLCSAIAMSCRDRPAPTEVLLDTAANRSLFSNRDLLRNVRKCPAHDFIGINGDRMRVRHVGEFESFGDVFWEQSANSNVLSFAEVVADRGVRMEMLDGGQAFEAMCADGRIFRFQLSKGLYVLNDEFSSVNVTTVKDLKASHTRREVEGADRARQLIRRMGVPSRAAVRHLVSAGGMKGVNVTTRDLDLAEAIYGPELAALKGKTTEPEAKSFDLTRIVSRRDVELQGYCDIAYIAGIPFFICVLKPIGLIMCCKLGVNPGARSKESLHEVVEMQLKSCAAFGFRVTALHYDGEGGLSDLAGKVGSYGVVCNAATGQHVGDVEVVIRLIKSWCRGIYTTLPWKLPMFLVEYLVSFVVMRLNMLPSKRGYLNVPAVEVFTGIKVDLDRDMRVAFGDYCQVATPNLNAKKNDVTTARTEGCIAIGQTGFVGTVLFVSLATKRLIKRQKFVVMPTPEEVIQIVNGWSALPDQTAVLEEAAATDEEFLELWPRMDDSEVHSDDGDRESVSETEDEESGMQEDSVVEQTEDNGDVVSPMEAIHGDDEVADGLAEEQSQGDSYVDQQPMDASDVDVPRVEQANVESNASQESTEGLRRSGRSARVDYRTLNNPPRVPVSYGYNITVRKALKEMPEAAESSIKSELSQLLRKEVMIPVKWRSLSAKQRKAAIRSFMFLKMKFQANGQFDKLKARLVANGAGQDKELYGDISSPTAATSSLMMVAAIAALEKRTVCTADITGAYLNAKMPLDGPKVHMIVEPELAKLLCELDETFKEYLRADGSVAVRLSGALYGCVESAKLWYDRIAGFLERIGFVKNEQDQCVFNHGEMEHQLSVVVYVDDLFITCTDAGKIDWLRKQLEDEFGQVTFHHGDSHGYLGMNFVYQRDELKVTMEPYIEDLLKLYEVKDTAPTPARESLFMVDPSEPLVGKDDQDRFHSMVAKLLYLAKRARPDLLQAISFLTTRVEKATKSDCGKLFRVLRYLKGTKELGISFKFKGKKGLDVRACADAAFGVHVDGKSHSGLVIAIGGGPIFVRSSKQKIVTKSSWEAELVALSDGGSQIIWSRNFLLAQGYDVPAIPVGQDNMGTIASINKGASGSDRSRHVHVRYFWLKDRIQSGEIAVEYVPTEEMVADVMTKALQGEKFEKMRGKLLNWRA